MKKFITLLLLFLMLFAGRNQAQNALNYVASTEGGSCYEVFYHNNFIYAGCANTLMVYDINTVNHTPGNITFKKRLLSNIDFITEHNGYLYVCANHDGLWKYDISVNPGSPVAVAHYVPQHLNESIYDIAFRGDSIIAAAKTNVLLLDGSGSQISYINTLASYSGDTRVRGVDVKDSLLAYTVSLSAGGSQDGVYLFNLNNLSQLDFYPNSTSTNQDVYFGQNTKLLHVMGGQMISTLVNGLYYVLDYTNPASLQLQFADTINGFLPLGSVSSPMNAELINDTLYISTHGGGPITFSIPFTCQIYVYDASNATNVHLLTDIYGGLYHFDASINPLTKRIYIASEWYGILTLDITDIYNEISLGKTLTGGWCHGSAKAKNRLAEASEGYGVRLYDVSTIQNPQLIAEDTAVGFCRAISISDSADYVFGWYLTGQRLRVFNGNNLSSVANATVDNSVLIISDFQKSRYCNGKLAVIEQINQGNQKIVVADVSNPAAPAILHYRQKNNVNDLLFHPNGDLLICSNDSIIVFNPVTMSVQSSVSPPLGSLLQPFKAFTLYNDTLYVFYENVGEGIAKYYFNSSLHTLSYLSAAVHPMTQTGNGRIFMASDSLGLYICSAIDSIKALDKNAPYAQLSSYNHGADFIYDELWGITDLYTKDGCLFLNEYMGQTNIFCPASSISTAGSSPKPEAELIIFPNPSNGFVTISTPVAAANTECLVQIFDSKGSLVYSTTSEQKKITLSTDGLAPGIYVVNINLAGILHTQKLVIR